jgi:RHS repeat-associated protein
VNGTANLLTGLNVDEIFSRTDQSGAADFLPGSLRSTFGLTSSNPTSIQTQYNYEPFGATTVSGTGNANPYKFTGRELDSESGLYYMRNRYYSPALSRFLSPDPIGIAGGDANLYAYVRNDPGTFTDRLGLCSGGVSSAFGTGLSTLDVIKLKSQFGSLAAATAAEDLDAGNTNAHATNLQLTTPGGHWKSRTHAVLISQ